jgi:hypothetical protein
LSEDTPRLAVETARVTDVKPHPQNPRVGNVATIAKSIEQHGQYKPIIVQRSTGYVLAGNHTLLALRQLGRESAEVTYLDVDDDQALRILLMDNKASDDSGYDDKMLLEVLQGLDAERGLIGTGFDAAELELLTFDATSQAPIEMPRTVEKNAGKNTASDSMVWGYLQFGTRRVVLTPVEVERLNHLHDTLIERENSDAGFGFEIADALDATWDVDSEKAAMDRLNKLNAKGKATDNRGRVVGADTVEDEVVDTTDADGDIDAAALDAAQGDQGFGDLEGDDVDGVEFEAGE